jgi:arylsulfatase A-like enzyme
VDRKISRREFLKLSSLALFAPYIASLFAEPDFKNSAGDLPNIAVLVFDSFSALNTTLYGYQRETTPNIQRLANQAIVYHRYYAGGHWTYPGTTTLLTGVNTWTHRGFNTSIRIPPEIVQNNLFSLFKNYYRVAYTHNPLADKILQQMNVNIENHQELQSLFIENNLILSKIFSNDYDTYSVAKVRSVKRIEDGTTYSLFLSNIYNYLRENSPAFDHYPQKPPSIEKDNYFRLEDAIDWVKLQIESLPEPFLGYFHLNPPHQPYSRRVEYFDVFNKDVQQFKEKPTHFLSRHTHQDGLNKSRRKYDEFILNVDAEIGRLFDSLKNNGALENTWIVITSDHGQMFERGIHGHYASVFYDPVVRVPLMILPPGNNQRIDIHEPTSAVDIIPTLLKITDQPMPKYLEGEVMSPFRDVEPDSQRSIYSVDARKNNPDEPLTRSTVMLLKDDYKMVYYLGYDESPDEKPYYELYHLQNDPEELENLVPKKPSIATAMLEEITEKLEEKNEPYI